VIGNDVVDIVQSRVESNWQRPGFLQKIFTPEEQQLILNVPEPEIMVWLLWSMKEAAYKIYNRQTAIRKFMPRDLQCIINLNEHHYYTEQVVCFENIYYTKSTLKQGNIHTVAVTCLQDLDNVIEIENKGILKDRYGIPYLLTDFENSAQSVSISHHGSLEKVVTLKPAYL
jgi:phosphopantetheinyl transferase (holo-ACP synthase)